MPGILPATSATKLPIRFKLILENSEGVVLYLTAKDTGEENWGPLHGKLERKPTEEMLSKAARALAGQVGVVDLRLMRTLFTEDRPSASDKVLRHYVMVHGTTLLVNPTVRSPLIKDVKVVTSLDDLQLALLYASGGTRSQMLRAVNDAKLLRRDVKIAAAASAGAYASV